MHKGESILHLLGKVMMKKNALYERRGALRRESRNRIYEKLLQEREAFAPEEISMSESSSDSEKSKSNHEILVSQTMEESHRKLITIGNNEPDKNEKPQAALQKSKMFQSEVELIHEPIKKPKMQISNLNQKKESIEVDLQKSLNNRRERRKRRIKIKRNRNLLKAVREISPRVKTTLKSKSALKPSKEIFNLVDSELRKVLNQKSAESINFENDKKDKQVVDSHRRRKKKFLQSDEKS